VGRDGKPVTKTLLKWISKEEAERELQRDGEIPFGKMLRCRVRYFTDGAMIGSKQFVNEAFESARERFRPKRKDGARKKRGEPSVAAVMLWSFRDLRKGIR
jgi:putative transposase